MEQLPGTLEDHSRSVVALADAETPTDVFRILLEAAGRCAPRTAIFLVRHGTIKGWAAVGYAAETARRLNGLAVERDSWMARIVDNPASGVMRPAPAESPPDFGQPPSAEVAALPVRVAERTVAIVLAESDTSGPDWSPDTLAALVAVASLRLELDLALRRMRGKTAEPATTSSASPPAGPEPSGLAPVAEKPAPSPDDARRDEAKTFARLVASEIRLYNEEAVMLGRQHGDLGERLAEQIKQGEQTFRRRFPDLGDLLHDAFVQVLAGGDAAALER